ncbi:MAG: indolepyruvate oxidoreductase subunit beta [Christensenellaceae bacterium]|jgi:indolepyruvate ferredoxin oxidoreductase beta subunit|nr:indolepyruvate oxidoreductase subunit beta [Christensenellaceae bacterium]
MLNLLIAGVGGQGTVLGARLLGLAALEKGLKLRGSETIGMAQRGGSVVSHLRLGEGAHSPLIPLGQADLLLAFEPAEALRALPFLRAGGHMLVADRAVQPAGMPHYDVPAVLACLKRRRPGSFFLGGDEVLARVGGRGLNVAMLGAAAALGLLPFGLAELETALRRRLAPHTIESNLRALHLGAKMAKEGGNKDGNDQ